MVLQQATGHEPAGNCRGCESGLTGHAPLPSQCLGRQRTGIGHGYSDWCAAHTDGHDYHGPSHQERRGRFRRHRLGTERLRGPSLATGRSDRPILRRHGSHVVRLQCRGTRLGEVPR